MLYWRKCELGNDDPRGDCSLPGANPLLYRQRSHTQRHTTCSNAPGLPALNAHKRICSSSTGHRHKQLQQRSAAAVSQTRTMQQFRAVPTSPPEMTISDPPAGRMSRSAAKASASDTTSAPLSQQVHVLPERMIDSAPAGRTKETWKPGGPPRVPPLK